MLYIKNYYYIYKKRKFIQMNKITSEEVERLNKEQKRNDRHPYTCDRRSKECEVNQTPRDYKKDGVLIATENRWVCPCGKYKQDY